MLKSSEDRVKCCVRDKSRLDSKDSVLVLLARLIRYRESGSMGTEAGDHGLNASPRGQPSHSEQRDRLRWTEPRRSEPGRGSW
jgi:hypothetical protein